jgi:hypothetical protein
MLRKLCSQANLLSAVAETVWTSVEKLGIDKKSARVQETLFRKKSAKNRKTTTNIKKYKIYSFVSKF